MKKSRKILFLTLVAIFLSVTTITVFANRNNIPVADFISSMLKSDIKDIGTEIKEQLESGDDFIIATINDIPIMRNELVFKNHQNELSYNMILKDESFKDQIDQGLIKRKNETELIQEIAKTRAIMKDAKEKGITFSREDAIAKLRKSQEKVKQQADADFEDRRDAWEKDQEFFKGLGMTEEEYITGPGADLEWEIQVCALHISAFYKEEHAKLETDPAYQVRDYKNYVDELFAKADLKILQENILSSTN